MSVAPTHLGNVQPEDANFFVPAPSSIGQVLSQSSSLKTSESGTVSGNSLRKAAIFVLVGLIGLVLYAITKNAIAIGAGLLFLGFAALLLLSTKRFECNYVGTKGIARYRIGKPDQEKNSMEGGVLLFDDAKYLYTNVIETRGVYPFYGQNATYQWMTDGNKFLFSILTAEYDPGVVPPDGKLVRFLIAAERSWTNHLFESAKSTLDSGGSVEFPYRKGGKATINADGLLLEIGQNVEIAGTELDSILHESGNLIFTSSSRGKVASVDCFHFANVLLLEELVSEKFGLVQGDSGVYRPNRE